MKKIKKQINKPKTKTTTTTNSESNNMQINHFPIYGFKCVFLLWNLHRKTTSISQTKMKVWFILKELCSEPAAIPVGNRTYEAAGFCSLSVNHHNLLPTQACYKTLRDTGKDVLVKLPLLVESEKFLQFGDVYNFVSSLGLFKIPVFLDW